MATTVNKRKETKEDLKTRLLRNHQEILDQAESVSLDDKDAEACFTYFINMTGTDHMIMNLKALNENPDTQKVYVIKKGERKNLNSVFSKESINSNRDALTESFTTLKSELDPDYPALLLVKEEDLKVQFPFSLIKTSVVDRMKAKGQQTLTLGINEYDEKLKVDYEKEEKSWEKVKAGGAHKAGNTNTKTKREVEASI